MYAVILPASMVLLHKARVNEPRPERQIGLQVWPLRGEFESATAATAHAINFWAALRYIAEYRSGNAGPRCAVG
ncbi:MAG TPA: hypothetical protein VHN17_04430 [Steroidobacteraceae bacterium]|nr:hypothetical protein [Steroidobacteraceae bacterium]